MRNPIALRLPAVLAILASLAVAAAPAPLPLVTDGPIVVDSNDLGAYILRIPEERRGDFLTSFERVMNTADSIFVARTLAARAKAEGLDRDAVTQRRVQQAEEQILAE